MRPNYEPYHDQAEIRYKEFVKNRIKWRARRPFLFAGLVLFTLTGVFFGYQSFFGSLSNEQLFDAHFECYNIGNDRVFHHMQAIRKYKEKDFEKAIELFTELYQQDSILGSNAFYLAISHVKCENYYIAINLFEKIALNRNNVYRNNSNWYLGLCYLKLHRNDKARKHFQLIIDSESEYANSAKKILKHIRY